jgi:hypothetical protein
MHKTKDEDKQNKKHNTICVGHHHTQYKRRRQTKQKTQHNMCWTTPQDTRRRQTKEKTQYVFPDRNGIIKFRSLIVSPFSDMWRIGVRGVRVMVFSATVINIFQLYSGGKF